MQPESRRLLRSVAPYAFACLLFAFSVGADLLLRRGAGSEFLFLALSLSIALSALYGGPGPGMLALAIGTVAGIALRPADPMSPLQATAFVGCVAGWFSVCLRVRSADRRLQRERAACAAAERTVGQSNRIAQLSAALGRACTPIEVADAAVHASMHGMTADAGMLLVVGDDVTSASIARAVAYRSSVAAEHQQISLVTTSPLRDATQRGAPVFLESANAWNAEYADEQGSVRYDEYAATAAIPLVVDRRVTAIVRLDFRQPRAFSADDEQFLSILAAGAAQVLDRARRYEVTQRARAHAEALREQADRELGERQRTEQALRASETRSRALATRTACMRDLTAALSEAVTMQAVAAAVVQQGTVLVGATAAGVALLATDGSEFETLGADEPRVFSASPGLCATEAARTREPIFVSSWVESQERYWRSASRAANAGHLSSVTLPLPVENVPIGVLEFHFRFPVNFDAEYRAVLVAVAQHCAQALDRARLYEASQQARAQAEAANRLKDDFLSILSHELRTPLNAVLGWASMLRGQFVKPEMVARAVQSIYDNAMRQTKLIDDLLDVSCMAAGSATLDLQEVDLATVISGVVDSIIPTASADQLDVSVSPMPPAMVLGDRRRLEQVFFNLLGNAVKFTPSGGHVSIDAVQTDHAVCVRVSDDGIGIEPQFVPHVFDRFRQGDSSPTRRYGGLGLGLSIAKQVVEAHHGQLTVESGGRGQGATFSVTLPLARGTAVHESDAQASASSQAVSESLASLAVLIVDDEPDAREVMAHALTACGARVLAAADAREALALLGSEHVDVLLADIAMPGMDGYALLRHIRALTDPRVATLPAIAVTAHARETERQEACAVGFQDHVAKPTDPVHLARVIGRLVRGAPCA